jgi:hypothetical protein
VISLKDEIKEILYLEKYIDKYKSDEKSIINGNILTSPAMLDYLEVKALLDYITNSQEKIKYNDLILKALHKYFTEHEEYENDEFLKQLESCTENDMIWLKRMAGDDNG